MKKDKAENIITTLSFFILYGIVLCMAIAIVAEMKHIENRIREIGENRIAQPAPDTLKTSEAETQVTPAISDWELMKLAIIEVESKGDNNAHNANGDCLGCLQLTPIYVDECNRLSGHKRYTLDDRLSRNKSLEMFELINKHHNPKKSIHRAIHLHNPRGGDAYKNRVLRKMEEMRDCF